jgi:hypothetical protein
VQADADHWGRVAAYPGLSPEVAAWAFNIARCARAEVALRQKGLQAQAPPQEGAAWGGGSTSVVTSQARRSSFPTPSTERVDCRVILF